MEQYKITKKQCEDGISGVCSRCGGELSAINTVDNSGNPTYWSGCEDCMCFDNGVTKTVYAIAVALHDKHYYRHYSTIKERPTDSAEKKQRNREQQIGGACGVVEKVLALAGNQ